jgi:hypothetical protein
MPLYCFLLSLIRAEYLLPSSLGDRAHAELTSILMGYVPVGEACIVARYSGAWTVGVSVDLDCPAHGLPCPLYALRGLLLGFGLSLFRRLIALNLSLSGLISTLAISLGLHSLVPAIH